ncbi:MAG TPA: Fic family protein [Lichenihabitans sp.]|jgi:hypothetical protein|nr:Fic family protein [Lichenihabitans sp.]
MRFSDTDVGGPLVTIFRGRRLPAEAHLAGYSALIEAFDLNVPLPHTLSAVSARSVRRKEDGWAIYPSTLRPRPHLVDHLVFALKHEGVELLILKNVFERLDGGELVAAAKTKPTSAYLRRLCFFYEWLTERRLDVPDTSAGAYVHAIDTTLQYAAARPVNDRRFRIRNNIPGDRRFCPLVHRTHALDAFIAGDIAERARRIVGSAPREVIARAAAFLLLSDSKASFAIEGERPPRDRLARWGGVIGKAGQITLTLDQIIRLQRELIGDDRFVQTGLRDEGGFVGRHNAFNEPEPEHISARASDLVDLLSGLLGFDEISSARGYDPILTAASVAFGFVYIHPFEDGNGRIHRFLMHHVLAERNVTPAEIVFPISTVILDDIARYKDVLEGVSRPLLDLIAWSPTTEGHVHVAGETADFYRYFDATAHSEYLFECLTRAVDHELPEELAFLEHRDRFHRQVTAIVDMGERRLDILLRFLRQNRGTLSRRARENEFAALTAEEVGRIEAIYRDGVRA